MASMMPVSCSPTPATATQSPMVTRQPGSPSLSRWVAGSARTASTPECDKGQAAVLPDDPSRNEPVGGHGTEERLEALGEAKLLKRRLGRIVVVVTR